MKCHYIPEKHIILSQMSREAQMGNFKNWGLGFGLSFAWVYLFSLNVTVYCWKTCGKQYRIRLQ